MFRLLWETLRSAALAVLLSHGAQCGAGDMTIEVIGLPPLQIDGQPAKAHTQGLELVGGNYYVTARREDVRPRRAFLLGTGIAGTNWNVWDITPEAAPGTLTAPDHPGGMQSDGTRLWIPIAESKPHGRSVIRTYLLADLQAGRPLKPAFEFSVSDHIGAVAVSLERGLLFGANWDTEKVYIWNLKGDLQRTLTGSELEARGLGVVAGPEGRAGVAVQDWKMVGERLFACGLYRSPNSAPVQPASRLCSFERFPESDFQRSIAPMPRRDGVELGREAMAISGGSVYFLPEDLGRSNRLFRVALSEFAKGVTMGRTYEHER